MIPGKASRVAKVEATISLIGTAAPSYSGPGGMVLAALGAHFVTAPVLYDGLPELTKPPWMRPWQASNVLDLVLHEHTMPHDPDP